MNVERLRRVRGQILDNPRNFDMDEWGRFDEKCGTVCCIGGLAAINAGLVRQVKYVNAWGDVMRLTKTGEKAVEGQGDQAGEAGLAPVYRVSLDLTVEESERLFLDDNWPDKFRTPYQESTNARQKARIAAKRITHFIRTKGRE